VKKVFGYLIAGVALVGSAPLLLRLANVNFIPSANWLSAVSWPANLFGIAFGIVCAVFILRTKDANPKLKDASSFKLTFMGLGVFLLMWMLSFLLVAVGTPLIYTAVVGSDASLSFEVKKPFDAGSRGCRPATKLANMTFLVDELCGTPRRLTDQLSKGDTIIAYGRGTQIGVFYDSFSFLPGEEN